MLKTFKCAYCGATFERKPTSVVSKNVCCSRTCARKFEAARRRERGENHRTQRKGPLPHEDVHIKVLHDIDLLPEFHPEKDTVYAAEKYRGQRGKKYIGYVICVNGHRVNIRENECVEV